MSVQSLNKNLYQAPWPKSLEPTPLRTITTFTYNALSCTLLFPIGITRLLNHWIIRPLIIENQLVQGIKRHKGHAIENNRVAFNMPNGQTIVGTFIEGTHRDKLIILNCGTGQWCEKITNKAILESGASILAINHPGVGSKKSYPGTGGVDFHESLGLATFSAFNFANKGFELEEQKYKFFEKNIALYGYSLGGTAATIAAQYIEETHGPTAVKLINDRSFNSVPKLATSLMLRIKNTPCKKIKGPKKAIKIFLFCIPNFLIRISIYCTTFLTGIRLDPESAFKKLQSKNKCVIYTKEDQIIPYKEGGALHKSIKKTKQYEKIQLSKEYDHMTPLEGDEKNLVLKHIQKFLKLTPVHSL
jgi:hypothetical protein